MNRLEAREYVELMTGQIGTVKSDGRRTLRKAMLNKIINEIQLDYFRATHSLEAFSHTVISDNQFEYTLPTNLLKDGIQRVTVDDAIYSHRQFPATVDGWEQSNAEDQVQTS